MASDFLFTFTLIYKNWPSDYSDWLLQFLIIMETHPKALIVFCSLTGNTEEIAIQLSKDLKIHNVEVKVKDLMEANASEYLQYDICVLATYSYENGDEIIPDEALDFFDDLGTLDLSGKVYAVLGSGQEDVYDDFCGAVDRFEDQFKLTKAIRVSDPIKIDFYLSNEEDEQRINNLAAVLATKFHGVTTMKM